MLKKGGVNAEARGGVKLPSVFQANAEQVLGDKAGGAVGNGLSSKQQPMKG